MEAFTIDIPDDPNSEANKAETVANILDIPLHRVNLSVNDIKEILPGLVKMTGPFMLPSPLLRARLAQAAQNAECEHVVTGDGPDELYAGYTSMLPGVRKGEIPGLDGFLERLGINLFTDWAFKPPHAEEWVAAWMAISPLFSKKFKEGIDLETLTAAHKRLATYIYELGLSKLDRMIAYELETRMRWSVDSVSSAPVRFIYGAPPVTPLFSPSVIFNSSITPEQLKVNIRGGTWYGKYLLRQMLATNLKYFRASDSDVEEIAWGPKRGMFTPISHLIQDAFPEVKNVDEFNPEAVSSTLQSQQSDLGHQVAMTSVITTDVFLTEVKKQ
jgi:asparagine synthetase B (glutamine-hydrolysing)